MIAVLDQPLADAGTFGNEPAVMDTVTGTVTPGKKILMQFGASFSALYQQEWPITYNKTGQVRACNAHPALTPQESPCEAEMVITHLAAQRDSNVGDRADFFYPMTVRRISQLLSQTLAATGTQRQANRAAIKRALGAK